MNNIFTKNRVDLIYSYFCCICFKLFFQLKKHSTEKGSCNQILKDKEFNLRCLETNLEECDGIQNNRNTKKFS